MNIVVASGGFDPVHSGHIEYLKAAKKLGDKLIVALNSDKWLVNKKGSNFMPFKERKAVIENLWVVDLVIDFKDDANNSACNALTKIKKLYPEDQIIFVNGGDRNSSNIPEMSLNGIEFVFGVGGTNKLNSSSLILNKWKNYHEDRIWGYFHNLYEDKNVKLKQLVIEPGKNTSFQRHFKRNELWFINKGSCVVYYKNSKDEILKANLNKFDQYRVSLRQWHQISNPYEERCHILEIQYGETCLEDDIERIVLNTTI